MENLANTYQSLSSILVWLTGTGGGAWLIVAWLVSWIAEDIPAWAKLNSKLKTVIMLVVAGAIGAGGQALLFRPEVVAAIDPYVRPFMYSAMIWLTNQLAHGKNPLRKE